MEIELERTFKPIEIDKTIDQDRTQELFGFSLNPQLTWKELLQKNRVVILAEPGTGKTEELISTTKSLRDKGCSAFFYRIELLQELGIRDSLDLGTSDEVDSWLAGDETGYFFLDSVDEATLISHSAYEVALRRFAKALGKHTNRAKVFISCRVSIWRATEDLSIFLKHLPSP